MKISCVLPVVALNVLGKCGAEAKLHDDAPSALINRPRSLLQPQEFVRSRELQAGLQPHPNLYYFTIFCASGSCSSPSDSFIFSYNITSPDSEKNYKGSPVEVPSAHTCPGSLAILPGASSLGNSMVTICCNDTQQKLFSIEPDAAPSTELVIDRAPPVGLGNIINECLSSIDIDSCGTVYASKNDGNLYIIKKSSTKALATYVGKLRLDTSIISDSERVMDLAFNSKNELWVQMGKVGSTDLQMQKCNVHSLACDNAITIKLESKSATPNKCWKRQSVDNSQPSHLGLALYSNDNAYGVVEVKQGSWSANSGSCDVKGDSERWVVKLNTADGSWTMAEKLENNNFPNNKAVRGGDFLPPETFTCAPSSSPSTSPSTDPSSAPSTDPSSAPSTDPSSAPSTDPSSAPSTDPSSAPSTDPSTSPSSSPSYICQDDDGDGICNENDKCPNVYDNGNRDVCCAANKGSCFNKVRDIDGLTMHTSVCHCTYAKNKGMGKSVCLSDRGAHEHMKVHLNTDHCGACNSGSCQFGGAPGVRTRKES